MIFHFVQLSRALAILTFVVWQCSFVSAQAFVTTWKTDNPGPSDDFTITIPIVSEIYYNFQVSWGDNSSEVFTGFGSELIVSHTYSSVGTYTVSIDGDFPRIYFNQSGDRQKILEVAEWGEIEWQSFESAFHGCSNLQVTALDAPNLSNVTSLKRMFRNASLLNASINNWQLNTITDLSEMFLFAISFNQPLNQWDVSNVGNMSELFSSASSFNQPLNDWNVSNVTNMSALFSNAHAFNQPLDNWNVSAVTDMNGMFNFASTFNQSINSWDVANVENMNGMFANASNFNQPLNNWNVSNLVSASNMFSQAQTFNQEIGTWDVSNITNMQAMFYSASSFNQPIGAWNVSNVTNMEGMFQSASSFNQPIESWNVSGVTHFAGMFQSASSFNQPIGSWDVSSANSNPFSGLLQMFNDAFSFNQPLNMWNVGNVSYMRNMFRGATSFNQPLDNWDVSNVSDMQRMFDGASAFDQSLDSWNISSCWNFAHMLSNSGMNYCNYDQTLQGWAAALPNYNQTLGATGLQYTAAGAPARFQLIDTFQWTITGDALIVPVSLEITSIVNGNQISVLASGGSGNYTYNWSGPDGFESTESNITAPINGSYTVVVSDGCETWTETFEILTVGISTSETEDFQLFPNPTTGLVYGFSNSLDFSKIQVFDLNGKKVFESDFTGNAISFDLSHLNSGVYLSRLLDKTGMEQAKQRICVVR
jgi:surface protein